MSGFQSALLEKIIENRFVNCVIVLLRERINDDGKCVFKRIFASFISPEQGAVLIQYRIQYRISHNLSCCTDNQRLYTISKSDFIFA